MKPMSSNELDLVSIKSQNNEGELKREERRLEKLFYFYRDVKDHLKQQNPLQQLALLKNENQQLMSDIIASSLQEKSLFMARLDSIWGKSISTKSNLKSE